MEEKTELSEKEFLLIIAETLLELIQTLSLHECQRYEHHKSDDLEIIARVFKEKLDKFN